jgi:hypothetical protein
MEYAWHLFVHGAENMIHSQNLWRMVAALTILLVGVGVVLVAQSANPQVIDAEELVEQAQQSPAAMGNTDQVVFTKTTTFQRRDPAAIEPADPYHLSVLNLISDTRVMEQWQRGGAQGEGRSKIYDAHSGRIIYEFARRQGQTRFFDGLEGYVTVFPATPGKPAEQAPPPFPRAARQHGLKIIGTRTSAWGKPAWIVEGHEQPPSQKQIEADATQPFFAQGPFLSDLRLKEIEYIWHVDQETRQFVLFEQWGVTAAERVLLQRIEKSKPELLTLQELPPNWAEMETAEAPLRQENMPPLPNIVKTQDPTQVLKAAGILYLPENSAGLTLDYHRFRSEPQPQKDWQKQWRFDIVDSSSYGLAVESLYVPAERGSGRALFIVQGEAGVLVPLMRETLPVWTQSHRINLNINGRPIDVWIASGGVLAAVSSQVVAMLEIDGKFIYVVGQELNENEIAAVVASLAPIQ